MLTNTECREQVSQFKQEYSNSFEELDLATKRILDAIIDQHDVFQAAHEAQLTLTETLCKDTIRNINDTRQEIIREIRVMFVSPPLQSHAYSVPLLANTAGYYRTGTVATQTPYCLPGGLQFN